MRALEELCGVPSPSFLPRGHPFSPEFSKCLLNSVSNPHPWPPSLALPRAGNKCLKFQILSAFLNASISSQIHRIIMNNSSSMVLFKQTQYIVYPFSTASWMSLFTRFIVLSMERGKAESNRLEPGCMKSLCLSPQGLSWAQTSYGKSFGWRFLVGKFSG